MRLVTAISVILMSVHYSKSQTASCATTGTNANYFLAWLSTTTNGDGTVLANPITSPPTGTTWQACNAIWMANGGSCCDLNKTITVFNTQTMSILNGWKAFIGSVGKVVPLLPKLKMLFNNSTEISRVFTAGIAAGPNDTKAAAPAGMTASQIADQLPKLVGDGFSETLNNFKTNAKACFDYANTLRGQVWCHGCSGYGWTNFTMGPTVSIKIDSANNLAVVCGKIWAFMGNVQSILNFALQFKRIKFALDGGSSMPTMNNTTMNNTTMPPVNNSTPGLPPPPKQGPPSFNKNITLGDLKTAFDNCIPTNFTVSGSCTQANLNLISKAHFSFFKPERVATAVNGDDATTATGQLGARLLQNADGDGAPEPSSTGLDLSATASPGAISSTSGSIDASQTGSTSSTSGNHATALLLSLFAFIAVLVSML